MAQVIELAVLGCLRQGAQHGYALHRQLSDPAGLGLLWQVKQAHLYGLLRRLEEKGYLTSTMQRQPSRPSRNDFRLTQLGHDAFLDWVGQPAPHGPDFRLDFLTRVYFAEREGVPFIARLFERQRAACRAWLREQAALADAARDTQPYAWRFCQLQISQIEAMLAWLSACEQKTPP